MKPLLVTRRMAKYDNLLPGYASVDDFAEHHGFSRTAVNQHFNQGYCKYPRRRAKTGYWGHPLYSLWESIIGRTQRKTDPRYPGYGGRGISMYTPWFLSIAEFIHYMDVNLGPKPTAAHSLDRIDNDGNYEPGNLRWATPAEQVHNQRVNSRNTSGIRHISRLPRTGKWLVCVERNNKQYRKQFDRFDDASQFLDVLLQQLKR